MKELKERYKDYDMVRVMNVNNLILAVLILVGIGVNHVMLNVFNKISKIGLVKIMTLMS